MWGFSRCLIFRPQPKTIRLMSVCVTGVCPAMGVYSRVALKHVAIQSERSWRGPAVVQRLWPSSPGPPSFRLFLFTNAGVSFLHLLPHLNQTEHKSNEKKQNSFPPILLLCFYFVVSLGGCKSTALLDGEGRVEASLFEKCWELAPTWYCTSAP